MAGQRASIYWTCQIAGWGLSGAIFLLLNIVSVSYTHLTLPTNREV